MAAAEDKLCVEVDGVPVSIDRTVMSDDIETLELLADADDGNVLAVVRLMRHVLGAEQYANVKASLAKDGRTSVSDMASFIGKVFEALGEDAKN